jgi:Na+/proline symporter
MPWKGIGVTISVIVACLITLGRATSVVVDWAWFSTIGYIGVFWTAFATKVVLFVAMFVVSALLLWANGRLALRFALPRQQRHGPMRWTASCYYTTTTVSWSGLATPMFMSNSRFSGCSSPLQPLPPSL